jgi:hypothetical protein
MEQKTADCSARVVSLVDRSLTSSADGSVEQVLRGSLILVIADDRYVGCAVPVGLVAPSRYVEQGTDEVTSPVLEFAEQDGTGTVVAVEDASAAALVADELDIDYTAGEDVGAVDTRLQGGKAVEVDTTDVAETCGDRPVAEGMAMATDAGTVVESDLGATTVTAEMAETTDAVTAAAGRDQGRNEEAADRMD